MMERLTEKNPHGEGYHLKVSGREHRYDAFDRLAAYEDTGMEPEEIKQALAVNDIRPELAITSGRLLELAQADKDGRVVVLPCKKGDTLWTYANYPAKHIYPFQICAIQLMEKTMSTTCVGRIKWSDIGKTVFLTREEAEAALKGGGE